MFFLRMLAGFLLAALMTACGGGGGSPGTTGGGSGSAATPTVTVELVDAAGQPITTVGGTQSSFARATVRDANGGAVAATVVTFGADAALARFVPAAGTALTDGSGIASVQVLPATSSSSGAGVLTADATVAGKTAKQGTTSFQIAQGSAVDPATAKVANFALLLDRSTLPNSGTATAKLTVTAVDSSNNVAPGAAVTVATDANTVYTPSGTVTNAQGQYSGQIGIGGDKSNRVVTITVTVNGIVKQTALQITGSQLELIVMPTVLAPGQPSSVSARATDATGQPIVGQTVTFSGDIAGAAGQATTDLNGKATRTFTAPTAVGSYLVQAAASGVTSQLSVQVGAGTTIPAATIPAGAQPSLAAVPNVVAPNPDGTSTNQAQLRFLFLDAQNRPVPNVRVRFAITSTGQGSFDSTLSTGTSTVYTNASGVATASFVPGPTGSPTDGVVLRACYSATDFAAGYTCTESVPGVNVRLTVAAQALAVSIGNDNVLNAGTGGTYIKTFVVTVADAAGRAVPDAPVDISLDITHFGKGLFSQEVTFPLNIADYDRYVPDVTTAPSVFGARVSCINEDRNRNGFVDPGDNTNGSVDSFGQPTLEPRRSDIILSYSDPAVRKTNAGGVLLIKIEYSQRFATWLAYRVRATTNVAGSQGSAERAFVTTFAEGDADNGSFHTPPYGVGACNSAD